MNAGLVEEVDGADKQNISQQLFAFFFFFFFNLQPSDPAGL